ncbi:MAG: glycosyltransferase family 39 protein [Pseudomonadota bacterium]
MAQSDEGNSKRVWQLTAIVLVGLLIFRIGALILGEYELYADEAQYWRWGQTLDWGYYSKPPLIAWVIATSTAVFGDAEWAVRLPAPILHTIAAGGLFLLGRAMYGLTAGALAAVGYALMPGVIVSSAIMSTDGVLLPFWCLALWLLWRQREQEGGYGEAALFGAVIGMAFLAKYAAIYLVIGIGLNALLDLETRRAVLSRKGAVIAAMAALVVAPHIIWNATHDFSTVSHTVDNANLGGPLFNLENIPKFIADQMGVFGPIGFIALIAGIFIFPAKARPHIRQRDRWLLCFILPVLIIIAGQAVLSRAHANWAATAYPAASVLVAAWLLRAQGNRMLWLAIAGLTLAAFQLVPDVAAGLKIGLGLGTAAAIAGLGAVFRWRPAGLLVAALLLHGTLMLGAAALFASPPSITAALGVDNALKRVRGWDEATQAVLMKAQDLGATAILVDEREVWHGIDYYGRNGLDIPLIAWRRNAGVKSFAETQPMTDDLDDRVLLASFRPGFRPRIRSDFLSMRRVGEVNIELGIRSDGCPIMRRLVLYELSGFKPQPRTTEWEQKFDGLQEAPNPPCSTSRR